MWWWSNSNYIIWLKRQKAKKMYFDRVIRNSNNNGIVYFQEDIYHYKIHLDEIPNKWESSLWLAVASIRLSIHTWRVIKLEIVLH